MGEDLVKDDFREKFVTVGSQHPDPKLWDAFKSKSASQDKPLGRLSQSLKVHQAWGNDTTPPETDVLDVTRGLLDPKIQKKYPLTDLDVDDIQGHLRPLKKHIRKSTEGLFEIVDGEAE